jgi:hypothetical protein
MAHKIGNMIKEQASSTGTGAFALSGAVAGFNTFASKLTADGDTTWYSARNGNEWEIGLGTRTSASVLARTTVVESSNSNALVNFSAAPVVFCTVPAAQIQTTASDPEAWHYVGDPGEPAFQNSFVNFDASHRAAFYKHDGRVYVKGLVKTGATGATVFTLPAGYRPDQEIRVATVCNAAFGGLYVGTSGVVQFEAGNPATWGALDGLSFRVA